MTSSLVLLATEPPDNFSSPTSWHFSHNSNDTNTPDSPYPSFLFTIQELNSFSEHDYVTSLISKAHAQTLFTKSQPPRPSLPPLPELFPLSSARPPLPGTRARVRQLVTPMNLTEVNTMPIDSAPTSPPDLTNSKSSRASSIVSSNLSDIAGPADISHFEEIGLDDTHHGSSLHNGGMSNETLYPGISGLSTGAQRRLLDKRPSMTSLGSRTASHTSFRDLTGSTKRPQYPNVQGQVNGAMHSVPSLGPPTNRMRRGFTSPSSTSLPLHPSQRSRSPSPATQGASYRSSSRGSNTSSRRGSNSTVGASPSLTISRRTSWQSIRRKSAQELEAEYDDDNDNNDIPDDAFVINIPISPRMPHERSPSPSGSGSSPSHTYFNQRASAPASFPDQRIYKHASITDKSPPMESVDEIPKPERVSSYSSVLSALDEDARVVTAALEEHATEKEAQRELEVQRGIRPISIDQEGVNAKIALPPLQKPSLMMDPLPMSKEKEAALSRTRPSHLPPKSKDEEEKHLRQYKRMMAAAQDAEKKRMTKLKADLDKKDIEERSKIDVWKHLILANWKDYKQDRRTRELWWKGVPPAIRGRVWTTGIGNELELTHDSYERALKKANDQLCLSKNDESEQPVIKKLNKLIEATYPAEKLFQEGLPWYRPLRDVLLAYSMYRPDVSLFAGMSNLTALLTLNLSQADAFIALANILNRPLPMSILLRDAARITAAYESVLKLMHVKLPLLYSHLFEKLRLHPDEFLGTMFDGLCIGHMSLDNACRLWDAMVFEGDRIFFRAAVGILSGLESKLYGTKEEVFAILGRDAETDILVKESPETFAFMIRAAAKVK